MRVVGLTGGIASGKSTVGRLLRDRHGLPVVDADELARRVMAPGGEALRRVEEEFGSPFLLPDGSLDRRAMGRLVVADPSARRRLEALVHPAVYRLLDEELEAFGAAGHALAVAEVPLLVETGDANRYECLVVVACRQETAVRRLVETRGMEEAEARAWLDTQLPVSEKAKLADVVIENDGTMDELEVAVTRALPVIREAAMGISGQPTPGRGCPRT